jgi:epoxyqueuosine reductase
LPEKLLHSLEERGYQGQVTSIRRLDDLQREIESRHKGGHLDEAFYKEWLTNFKFAPPDDLPEARSLWIVAARDPQIRFTFTWQTKRVQFLVPPTYLHWERTNQKVEYAVTAVLKPEGYGLCKAVVPRKLLAVRSGLAKYGKNNITYIDGLGSFHRLVAFFSNFPCDHDDWQKSRMMERCQTCSACIQACPSGAITQERFLLHAEKCIVFHNEQPDDVPFPKWLDPSWHNCLVGCLHCQRVCPESKDCLGWLEEGAEFSEEETGLLLEGTPLDELPPETAKKLEQWDLVELLDVLPRNLRALLEKTEL